MEKIKSVEIFRLIAIIGVIAIHTRPFEMGSDYEWYKDANFIINQLARFSVPFFFVISGFFWGLKVRNGNNDPIAIANISAKRITYLYLFWSAIYLIPYDITRIIDHGLAGPIGEVWWTIKTIIKNPTLLVTQGTKSHTWFLASLIYSIYICAFLIKKNSHITLIVTSILFYAYSVLSQAYLDTPLEIRVNDCFNTRNGPFFGLILFASGYYISKMKNTSKWIIYGFFVLDLPYNFWRFIVLKNIFIKQRNGAILLEHILWVLGVLWHHYRITDIYRTEYLAKLVK